MSRIGKQPIPLPEKVAVKIDPQNQVLVEGPQGRLKFNLPLVLELEMKDNLLLVKPRDETRTTRALHGTWRALLANAVKGVSQGYEKVLELVGLGYRAEVKEGQLILQVGFSHPVKMRIPADLEVRAEKTKIFIRGIDKQRVGEFAAQVRRVRKPEPYKGTGIRYQGEIIRRKPGKAAKGAGA